MRKSIEVYSIVDQASRSKNDDIRRYAQSIISLHQEAKERLFQASLRLLVVPVLGYGTYELLKSIPQSNGIFEGVLRFGGFVATGLGTFMLARGGIEDVSGSIQARSEATALTVALASHLIVEGDS